MKSRGALNVLDGFHCVSLFFFLSSLFLPFSPFLCMFLVVVVAVVIVNGGGHGGSSTPRETSKSNNVGSQCPDMIPM